MKLFAIGALLLTSFLPASFANAANKADLYDLLNRIDLELRYYDQNPAILDSVKFDLEKALSTLRGEVVNPRECMDFAYESYRKDGYSNSSSLEKAKTYCSQARSLGASIEVIKYFYAGLTKDGYSNSSSLTKALEMSHNLSERDLGCIDEAYNRYKADGYSNRSALEKSADFCRI
ncbi:MAG: hypothetical protein M9962_02710 [Oligoflexia bacterium]|nr:hypothetical protein [Oligoflexia bacterium]